MVKIYVCDKLTRGGGSKSRTGYEGKIRDLKWLRFKYSGKHPRRNPFQKVVFLKTFLVICLLTLLVDKRVFIYLYEKGPELDQRIISKGSDKGCIFDSFIPWYDEALIKYKIYTIYACIYHSICDYCICLSGFR